MKRVLLFVISLLFVGPAESIRPPRIFVLHQVPLVQQFMDYSCGAAALQSVLAYYGTELKEKEVIDAVHTGPDHGTEIEPMAELAKKHKIGAEIRTNLTIAEIARTIQKKQLVIVDFQAWSDRENQKKIGYQDVWDSGHYAVVIGVSRTNIYFMDPSLLGGRGVMPIKEFLTRWHELNSKNEKVYGAGIIFNGEPKPPAPWQTID